MVEIREYKPSSAKLKMLIYGKSGTGKTTFGSTAPKVLFVSSESGLLSIADKNIKYVKINSMQDLRDVHAMLLKPGHGFETVVLDSLTDIQNHIIAQITGGKRMPQKGEWSDFGFEMNKILRQFRDLDLHVIFLALETDKSGDDDDDKSVYMPDFYGSVREKASAYMDFVGRLAMWSVTDDNGVKQQKRGICFIFNQRFVAKARRGKFEAITEPDFEAILKVATIETGEEKIISQVPTATEERPKQVAQPAPVILFPKEEGDVLRSSDQSTQILELWNELMNVQNRKPEERDAIREATMVKWYGVKSMNMLRSKQAVHFIDMIIQTITDAKAKERLPMEESQTYDISKDLDRRRELDENYDKEQLAAFAKSKGIKVTTATTKQDMINSIMAIEMPNAPKPISK